MATSSSQTNASQRNLSELKIHQYEIQNFMEIRKSDEFLNFDVEKLQCLLESDNLNITCEKDAYGAITRWFIHDVSARQEYLPRLVACLRLTQFDLNFLLTQIHSLPGCELLASQASMYISKPAARSKIDIRFTEPRVGISAGNCAEKTLQGVHTEVQAKNPCELQNNKACIRNPTEQSKINIRFTEPHVGLAASNCDEKTLLINFKEVNTTKPCVLQYKKAEDKWQKYKDLDEDNANSNTILKDDSLLFIGGDSLNSPSKRGWCWNISNKTWGKSLEDMKQARKEHSVVELDGKIYAIGGSEILRYTMGTNTYLQSVERYTESNGWEFVAPLLTARHGAGAVTLNGKIYVMGGSNGNFLKSVECYHPDSNTWTSCADMSYDYFLLSVAAHNGHIYVVGDCRRGSVVERYDPQRDTWSQICSLESRDWCGFACTSFDNKLWAIGLGVKEGRTEVAVYDEANDDWVQKSPLPEGWIYSCFVVSLSLLTSN